MVKVICVSGSVGCGKTTISKELAKKINYQYLSLNELIKEKKLEGKHLKKFDSYEVDIKKLNKVVEKIIKNSKKNLVIDGHMSHYLDKKYVDLCVVCKCDLIELKRRLEERKYNKDKIRENLDSEIFDVCLVEAFENKHKVLVVQTDENSVNESIKIICKEIK